VDFKAEVTRCTAVLSSAQQTLQQALAAQNKENNEQINSDVPEVASQLNMSHLNSMTDILSKPSGIFKFNTVPCTDTIQFPLKPIILFNLFWMAMLNVIEYWYTLYVVKLFFLAFSSVGSNGKTAQVFISLLLGTINR
jgi:hypothetical protein